MTVLRAMCTATLALLVAGCGGDSKPDVEGVRQLAEQARADLVAGREARFCALLTPHGRARSLGFKVDFDEYGRIPSSSPRLPQTCEQVARRERSYRTDPSWVPELRDAKLSIVDVRSKTARIEIFLHGRRYPDAVVRAVRTPAGWRLDDSNVIPVGH